MLAHQRQEQLLDEVRRAGSVRVADIAERLGVSDMTIRRDITQLAGKGLLERVHGGAALVSEPSTSEPGFEAKSVRQLREKESIAQRAAQLVTAGMAVGIGAGTTTWAFARELIDVPALTVVTNSLPVAEVFHAQPRADRTVLLTGGSRTLSNALVGPIGVAAVRSLHLDVAFLGTHGLDLGAGLSSPNLLEADINRAIMSSARRVVVLSDHTKFGIIGISSFAALEDVDTLITDAGLPRATRDELAERVGELVVA